MRGTVGAAIGLFTFPTPLSLSASGEEGRLPLCPRRGALASSVLSDLSEARVPGNARTQSHKEEQLVPWEVSPDPE